MLPLIFLILNQTVMKSEVTTVFQFRTSDVGHKNLFVTEQLQVLVPCCNYLTVDACTCRPVQLMINPFPLAEILDCIHFNSHFTSVYTSGVEYVKAILNYSLTKTLDGPVTIPREYKRGREGHLRNIFEILLGCTLDRFVSRVHG